MSQMSPVIAADTLAGVMTISADVLGADVPGDRDLFDAGASSLAVIRILVTCNERFGVALTGADLGDDASPRQIAASIDAARAA